MSSDDLKLTSPAALRNRGPISNILQNSLPKTGTILEIASGSGEHIVHFAQIMPSLTWQPTDLATDALASIQARIDDGGASNIEQPLQLDASTECWPVEQADGVIAINMVHISPWSATMGVIKGASKLLSTDQPLVFYGPYRQDGRAFASSNAQFDVDLRQRNPDWGIRKLEDVTALAREAGFTLDRIIDMPANNLTVIFRRQ